MDDKNCCKFSFYALFFCKKISDSESLKNVNNSYYFLLFYVKMSTFRIRLLVWCRCLYPEPDTLGLRNQTFFCSDVLILVSCMRELFLWRNV